MISQHDTFFGSAYHAMYIDLPSGGNDYEVGGEYGCYQTSVGISKDISKINDALEKAKQLL